MSSEPRVPGSDHPITIARHPARIVVRSGGVTVADSRDALALREGAYPPVFYIPRKDVDMSKLTRTQHTSHCPYKGDASYYSIAPGGERATNAVWSYESPYPAVAAIRDLLAFYPSRVDAIEEGAPG